MHILAKAAHRFAEARGHHSDIIGGDHHGIALAHTRDGFFHRCGEDRAGNAGIAAGFKDGAASVRVCGLAGASAQREREITGADQHKIDAGRPRDCGGIVDAARGLDHDTQHRALVGDRAILEKAAGQWTDAATRSLSRRWEARRGNRKRSFGGILDQRDDDAFGAGVERLADRGGGVLGHAHQRRRAGGDCADRAFEVRAIP